MYAQIALGDGASEAGLYLLIFFAGFATATQVGGRILDKRGAKPAVVPGAIIAAVGFYLWAGDPARPRRQRPVALDRDRRRSAWA